MSRKISRELALSAVNSYCFEKNENAAKAIFDNCDYLEELHAGKLSQVDKDYAKSLYNGVVENFDNLIEIIKSCVKDFSFSQIFKLDLSILLISIFEIKTNFTPVAVSINEAVELAKKYSTKKSPSFVNAVLSTYAKTLE